MSPSSDCSRNPYPLYHPDVGLSLLRVVEPLVQLLLRVPRNPQGPLVFGFLVEGGPVVRRFLLEEETIDAKYRVAGASSRNSRGYLGVLLCLVDLLVQAEDALPELVEVGRNPVLPVLRGVHARV